jgi:hypothetical protein
MSHPNSRPVLHWSHLLGAARDELARVDSDLARIPLRDLSAGMRRAHEEARLQSERAA